MIGEEGESASESVAMLDRGMRSAGSAEAWQVQGVRDLGGPLRVLAMPPAEEAADNYLR